MIPKTIIIVPWTEAFQSQDIKFKVDNWFDDCREWYKLGYFRALFFYVKKYLHQYQCLKWVKKLAKM